MSPIDSNAENALPALVENHEPYTSEIPENATFLRVNVSAANLRRGIGTNTSILQRLNYGELLILLDSFPDWVLVQTLDSGIKGYVAKRLLH